MIIDLPDPVGPTMPTVSPGLIVNEMFFKIGRSGLYEKLTSLNSILALVGLSSKAFGRS